MAHKRDPAGHLGRACGLKEGEREGEDEKRGNERSQEHGSRNLRGRKAGQETE